MMVTTGGRGLSFAVSSSSMTSLAESVSSRVTSGLSSRVMGAFLVISLTTSSAVEKSTLSLMVLMMPSMKRVLMSSEAGMPVFSLSTLMGTGSVVMTAWSMTVA